MWVRNDSYRFRGCDRGFRHGDLGFQSGLPNAFGERLFGTGKRHLKATRRARCPRVIWASADDAVGLAAGAEDFHRIHPLRSLEAAQTLRTTFVVRDPIVLS